MEHDIYKKPALEGFGTARMRGIEERMQKIMRQYLLPAGYEFQKIRDDFDRLAAGKELFDLYALRALSAAEDNNQRLELLERFHTYVLPDYDDLAVVQTDIRNTVAGVIRACRTTAMRPIETPFGRMDGMTADHVFDKAMDVVDTIRYAGPDSVQGTFDLLCELYSDATSDAQRKRLLTSGEHLAENELAVWNQAGPVVQHILAERILDSDLERAGPIRPLLLKVLSELLKPEVSGTSSTYKTFTWSTTAATPSDALVTIRARAVGALKKLFRLSKSDGERAEIIQTLSEATATPHRGNYPDGLLRLILGNTFEIVEFYMSEAANLSFEILQKLEHDFLWLYRRNREMPADSKRDPVAREIAERLTAEILRFRDKVNRDEGFVTYKVLVGFESVFPPAWENPNFDYEGEEAYRGREIERLIDEIDERNADKWLQIISRCLSTKSNDLATFQHFGPFLESLGTKKPSIALRYLNEVDAGLESIIPPLLKGLEASASEAAAAKIKGWIDKKEYISRILWYYRFSARAGVDAIKHTAAAALEAGDKHAVENAVAVATARYKDLGAELIETVLLPGIDWLEKKGHRQWAGGLWIVHGEDSPFQNLSVDQARRVLVHLVSRESIDTRLDYLLGAIGKAHPEILIDFLGARVRHERELKADGEAFKKYEAIPFRFHGAKDTLKKVPGHMLKNMRAWYEDDDELFSLRAGRLAHSVYQKITLELAASFLEIIQAGDKEDLAFMLEVLERFEGAEEARPIYKAIVAKLPIGDPLLGAVRVGFNGTGVTTGEFGRVEAYKVRRAAMVPWRDDPNENIRHFAEAQVQLLDRMIASEQRQAEEDLELRKRTWGTDSNEDKVDPV
jgi:hypothetical protein